MLSAGWETKISASRDANAAVTILQKEQVVCGASCQEKT